MSHTEPTKENELPFFASGIVVKGFGRGSKDLGIPTANFSRDVIQELPKNISTGVYYGWAQVEKSPVYMMVMSIGWNPFYNNIEKSMEIHILKQFDEDFYGSNLKVKVVGFIRPELNFNSVDELVNTIHSDIEYAKQNLDENEKMDEYFVL
ncbi:putative riboflavin kinase [Rhopalosiphum maidis]|uniref:putative riboflavin kinase n=1 Tax=Rhopalosiphum maidis TaxID=43146 RepID=UPI000EFEB815|nr:putative riboflavin kinase [Rhopalosiphum maidis]